MSWNFSMETVLDLVGAKTRGKVTRAGEIEVQCPHGVCGHKKQPIYFSVNLAKGQYNCFHCCSGCPYSGGMIDLYCMFTGLDPNNKKEVKKAFAQALDTQQHAGLNLTTSIGKKPVGESATRNICSRAMIGMNCYELLRKNNRGSLKEVLNLILAERKGTTRIKFSHEKIRAVHSGRYAAISNEELLEIMDEYMAQNWPNHEFISAYVSHELMQVVIDLSAYKQQFFRKLPPELCRGYAPAVVMISSDVAESAVRLIPAFNMGGVIAPMAKEVAIPHIGDNIEDRVRNAFTALLAYFDDAATDISKLSTIPINYGKATLVRVLTKYGMPKEESREALVAYDMWHASGNVTAMDIYLSVCEAYAAVVRNHAQDAKKIFTAADCVARCARTLWSTMDMPGKEDM